ncbi:MAG: HD domain-containing protein [Desulfobulbaceae bacterium]|nr:HD domain-containing protein [Desulfobulbaceae bacterium]
MKGCLIKDIKDNQSVEGLFMVREVSRGETKTGSPFLSLTLLDASGEMAGRVWDNAERLQEHCQPGTIIRLRGQSQSYKGVMQLRVDHLEKTEVTAEELALFIPAAPGDLKEMLTELTRLAKSIANQHLRNLTLAFLTDRRLSGLLKKAPAAKYMHHAYLGGLLEHTLGVARLADMVAGLYPAIDRSLLLAGAIMHDLGKLIEFDYERYPYDYSDRGRLVGHTVLGTELLRKLADAIADFPEETLTRLQHLVLSHHGEHAFGAPTLPMMLEAFVLHFLDNLDSKVNYIAGLGRRRQEPGYHWSEFQRNLERFLYVRNSDTDQPEGLDANGREIDLRQGILWKA